MDKDFQNLQKIWDYMTYSNSLEKADLIIAFGSRDLSVAERATKIYQQGYADKILFSGGLGKDTKNIWQKSEAELFADVAIKNNVPKEAILIEKKSSNTGENIAFTRQLIKDKNLNVKKAIIVHQPNMNRRIFAALKKQWPELELVIASADCSLKEYIDNLTKLGLTKQQIYSNMVGDLQRMKVYSELGYQIEQEIPNQVWQACQELVEAGYTEYLI